ncbi:MAG: biotin-dependent carboxyltransferase family protein [Marmoricola sp.]
MSRRENALEVCATGPLATVQDLGRPGQQALGVGVSGAVDRPSLRLANRLLGNDEGEAGIEVTLGGLVVRAHGDLLAALTGAPCPARLDEVPVGTAAPFRMPAGSTLRLDPAPSGLRTYLALRGGLDVAPVLGSRSTDVLAGIGPAVLAAGTVLPVGPPPLTQPNVDLAPVRGLPEAEVLLRVAPGPRTDWFTRGALATLGSAAYTVTAESNRVGMRLDGPRLERDIEGELPSEGMVCGSLQVPPSGLPTLFLDDHPVTGGYPVIGVVCSADLPLAGQARPGFRLRFRLNCDALEERR